MDFFGNTLTECGDIIGPDTLIFDPEDETLMADIAKQVNARNGYFRIGPQYLIYSSDRIKEVRPVADHCEHKYWLVNRWDSLESTTGYQSIKELISKNQDKIWSKNRRAI